MFCARLKVSFLGDCVGDCVLCEVEKEGASCVARGERHFFLDVFVTRAVVGHFFFFSFSFSPIFSVPVRGVVVTQLFSPVFHPLIRKREKEHSKQTQAQVSPVNPRRTTNQQQTINNKPTNKNKKRIFFPPTPRRDHGRCRTDHGDDDASAAVAVAVVVSLLSWRQQRGCGQCKPECERYWRGCEWREWREWRRCCCCRWRRCKHRTRRWWW